MFPHPSGSQQYSKSSLFLLFWVSVIVWGFDLWVKSEVSPSDSPDSLVGFGVGEGRRLGPTMGGSCGGLPGLCPPRRIVSRWAWCDPSVSVTAVTPCELDATRAEQTGLWLLGGKSAA